MEEIWRIHEELDREAQRELEQEKEKMESEENENEKNEQEDEENLESSVRQSYIMSVKCIEEILIELKNRKYDNYDFLLSSYKEMSLMFDNLKRTKLDNGIDTKIALKLLLALVKYRGSIIIQDLVLESLGIGPSLKPNKLRSESEEGLRQYQVRNKSKKTPDFFIGGNIGDVKVDFTGMANKNSVKKELIKYYGENVVLKFINGYVSINENISSNLVDLALIVYNNVSILSSIQRKLEDELKTLGIVDEKTELKKSSKIALMMDSLVTPEIFNYLTADVYDENFLNELELKLLERTRDWMKKFTSTCIGASEIIEIVKDKYKNEELKEDISKQIHELRNEEEKNGRSEKYNEMRESLEKKLKNETLQSNITYFPVSAIKQDISGEEEVLTENKYVLGLLEIRKNENISTTKEKYRDELSDKIKLLSWVKTAPIGEGENPKLKLMKIKLLEKEIQDMKVKVNEKLLLTEIQNDGNFIFKQEKLIDRLKMGVGL